MRSEGMEDMIRHTVGLVTSQNGWLKARNKYRGIALSGEDWCDVWHGRLIITPDGIGNNNNNNNNNNGRNGSFFTWLATS